jgi:SAM-dependent methyltransferase
MTAALQYPGLHTQPDEGERPGRLVQTIRRFLRAQFGRPTGVWGGMAGRIMAHRSSNNERIRWTLGLLDIQPGDRILEIGFGPGVAIAQASALAADGFVAGIDHSEVMVRQAARRNGEALRHGRVALRLGSAMNLPTFDQPFDKIFTINSIHFWSEPVDCLRALGRLLRPGGLLAVTIQPRSRRATPETTKVIGEELVMKLERAGFSPCRLEIKAAQPVAVACALGLKVGAE